MRNRWRGRVFATLALWALCISSAMGADSKAFYGQWVMTLEGHTFVVLKLAAAAAHAEVSGSFDKPAKINLTNSLFSVTPGPAQHDLVKGQFRSDGLHLDVYKPGEAQPSTSFVMVLKDGDHAELAIEGLPPGAAMAPWSFLRSANDEKVFTDWQVSRTYSQADSGVSSTEMKRLYDADQQDRQKLPVDWTVVAKTDAQRRARTLALLDAGQLHTGADFREAAFIFQHGDSPRDYLQAHILAMQAMAKGDPSAAWIAAATMDRYLLSIKQPQAFGTQFEFAKDGKSRGATVQPYDAELVPDALKAQFGVTAPAH